jgi:hypothetical protein
LVIHHRTLILVAKPSDPAGAAGTGVGRGSAVLR